MLIAIPFQAMTLRLTNGLLGQLVQNLAILEFRLEPLLRYVMVSNFLHVQGLHNTKQDCATSMLARVNAHLIVLL